MTIARVLTLLATLTIPSFAAHLSFNNLGDNVPVTTQYASMGVIFQQVQARQAFTSEVDMVGPPTYVDVSPVGAMFYFVMPVNNAVQAFTNAVSFTALGKKTTSGWFNGFVARAYTHDDILVDSFVVNPSHFGTQTAPTNVLLAGAGIHKVMIALIPTLNSAGQPTYDAIAPIDDLFFGDLQQVPEPSTMLISGAGLVGLILFRRRRNAG